MIFNRHSDLIGKHALLSPSNYSWLNYDDIKMEARYKAAQAARRGSDLHELAVMAIQLGVKLAKSNLAMSSYVNDAIGYRMACEQPLYYSPNCFGTADTIQFRRNKLRIHDLKTGLIQASEHQLEVYAAIFCLEYEVDPFTIEVELRIYQRDEIRIFEPPPEHIQDIMDKIVELDKQIDALKEKEEVHW